MSFFGRHQKTNEKSVADKGIELLIWMRPFWETLTMSVLPEGVSSIYEKIDNRGNKSNEAVWEQICKIADNKTHHSFKKRHPFTKEFYEAISENDLNKLTNLATSLREKNLMYESLFDVLQMKSVQDCIKKDELEKSPLPLITKQIKKMQAIYLKKGEIVKMWDELYESMSFPFSSLKRSFSEGDWKEVASNLIQNLKDRHRHSGKNQDTTEEESLAAELEAYKKSFATDILGIKDSPASEGESSATHRPPSPGGR